MAIVDIEDLRVDLRHRDGDLRVVDGVSLSIAPGETLGLVGESGCGKTTTAMTIPRLLPRNARIGGRVLLEGDDLLALGPRELRRVRGARIGVIFQDPMTSLNPTRTIGDQIAEPLRIHGDRDRRTGQTRALELLARVGVPDARTRLRAYPHQLSGGLRQRVMIAIALACRPSLLIADEPTTALDVSIQAQVLALMAELKEEMGTAMLLITHDLGVIAGQADRTCVMYAGRIVEEGPTDAVFARPQHPYTKALLGSLPRPGQTRAQPLQAIPGAPPDLRRRRVGCAFAERCPAREDDCIAAPPPLTQAEGRRAYACNHPVAAWASGVEVAR